MSNGNISEDEQDLVTLGGILRGHAKFCGITQNLLHIYRADEPRTFPKSRHVLCSRSTPRFPDPDVKANDTVLVNLETGKIENKCKFEVGAMCMIKGGNNTGRVGVITTREKHPGSSPRSVPQKVSVFPSKTSGRATSCPDLQTIWRRIMLEKIIKNSALTSRDEVE